MKTMPLLVYDRQHCYNKEVVSVETHLNFYYMYDSFIPFSFLFLLTADFVNTCPLVCSYVIFLVIKPLELIKCNSNSANKSNALTIKY
jgi:hypothetical protein